MPTAQTHQNLNCVLVTSEHGFHDYDVKDHPVLRRACVPVDIKKGQRFNVYFGESSKAGAVWAGNLEKSLAEWLETATI
ncbi:hypothetical protein RYA05_03990 [Pseudomonas syringae pv. actinidiae]|nr:hypothetical protein [Pseudomonas syringae pv. actinidiae]